MAAGRNGDNISPFAAISPIGTSSGDIFFPPETYAALSAVTGFYIYFCFVNKSHKKSNQCLSGNDKR